MSIVVGVVRYSTAHASRAHAISPQCAHTSAAALVAAAAPPPRAHDSIDRDASTWERG